MVDFIAGLAFVVIHGLVVLTIFGLAAHLISVVMCGIDTTHRLIAAATGFLIYFTARLSGVSIPEIMLEALAQGSPFRAAIVAYVLPGGAGVAVSALLAYFVKKSEDQTRENRILVMLDVFALLMFADVYAVLATGQRPGLAIEPNLMFMIGLGLHQILFGDPREVAGFIRSNAGGWFR